MYYVWLVGAGNTQSWTRLYPNLQSAIDYAVMMENDGYDVQVRNAATGELVYE
jgi:hypothetical protein